MKDTDDRLDVNMKPESPEHAIATLTKNGYSRDGMHRYAKAARSWTEKGSPEWDTWLEVEKTTAEPTVEGDDG